MPYSDLRSFLKVLEEKGRLKRITKKVNKDWEIAAVARVLFQDIPEKDRPALLFENVEGFEIPVVRAGPRKLDRAISDRTAPF